MKRMLTLVMLAGLWSAAIPQVLRAQEFPIDIVERTGNGPADAEDRKEALKILNRYTKCLKDRQFKPCFGLLSRNVLRIWRELYDVHTSAQYAEDKGTEEIYYTAVRAIRVRREGPHLVIIARVRGGGEGGPFVGEKEFRLVKENGDWRIDRMREGGVEYLP